VIDVQTKNRQNNALSRLIHSCAASGLAGCIIGYGRGYAADAVPQLPEHWCSFCQPQKDDRLSQPHLVLIQCISGPEHPKSATVTAKPTPGFSQPIYLKKLRFSQVTYNQTQNHSWRERIGETKPIISCLQRNFCWEKKIKSLIKNINTQNLAYVDNLANDNLKNNWCLNSVTWSENPLQISSQLDENWGF